MDSQGASMNSRRRARLAYAIAPTRPGGRGSNPGSGRLRGLANGPIVHVLDKFERMHSRPPAAEPVPLPPGYRFVRDRSRAGASERLIEAEANGSRVALRL